MLAEPDVLERVWDPDAVCAILDEGGELAGPLGELLTSRGWRVAVVEIDLSDPSSWSNTFAALGGRVAMFIDIHSPAEDSTADPLWNESEEARVKASFLLAAHLQPMLTAPAAARGCYAVVTRVDGRLGLDATPKTRGIVTAGVAALAKTLKHEWPAVHCRAIDLDPAMDPDTAAQLIAGELTDPDETLLEVGHGLDGRCTIEATDAVHRA
jgi:hypothetical protein